MDHGPMIFNMERARKFGQMGPLTRDPIMRESSKVKESFRAEAISIQGSL